jgi:hypothetical protein
VHLGRYALVVLHNAIDHHAVSGSNEAQGKASTCAVGELGTSTYFIRCGERMCVASSCRIDSTLIMITFFLRRTVAASSSPING